MIFFPSPLVGEGGSTARSGGETDEGSVSADRDPSSTLPSARHLLPQGEKEKISTFRLIQLGFHPAFRRRARHQRVVPAFDVGKILQLDLVARVAPGPTE